VLAKLPDERACRQPEQIITTVGATHALDIVSRTLLRPGDW
jgi:DNA-binding transcriptional MocR family regulator